MSSSTVYGGDEINAVVLDPGSYQTRIGYAGDDFPKVTTYSSYAEKDGHKIFGEGITVPRPGYEIKPLLHNSIITDWDTALEQYKHYFKQLKIEYREQPLLMTEPVWSEPDYRKKIVELIYEELDFPALYLAKTPTCVSFQQGRANCLVVDLGHDSVSVTPVIDGISLMKNSMRTTYGGRFLSAEIADYLATKSVDIVPTYKIKTKEPVVYPTEPSYTTRSGIPETTASFDAFQREKVLHEIKESALEVPDKRINIPNQAVREFYSQDEHRRLFEMPTGQAVPLGVERFLLADSVFDPLSYKFANEANAAQWPRDNGEITLLNKYEDYRPLKRSVKRAELNQLTPPPQVEVGAGEKPTDSSYSPQSGCRGVAQLVTHILSTIDIDLRASVAHNIIVTGGVSLVPQLTERLYNELSNSNPGLKIRLHAVGNALERVNQLWIGGSVLASLGTFHQLWVSKEEYYEAGSDRILNQRFR